ncbi:hypothetical protein [Massilia pseudoviolaceinigra]|uniref:hypothetical protein n=1 Tax=Massilia pseudoviolaceinigra TaxID=3057165 RepID=UPI002796896C|nr:hypothetical protein [Massilia sp. CCM 9206]MDQ1921159.1 hypothetical protein [Massilia sp. CCM 9206]
MPANFTGMVARVCDGPEKTSSRAKFIPSEPLLVILLSGIADFHWQIRASI